MSVFRLKVVYHDEPDVYRTIDIRGDQNFHALHKSILKSMSFKEGELASFYILKSDLDDSKKIEICLSDMQTTDNSLLMNETAIADVLGDEVTDITYIYDFMNYYTFDIELLEILNKTDEKAKYPIIVESVGDAPLQFDLMGEEEWTEEDFKLFSDVKSKNTRFFNEDDGFGPDYEEEVFDEDDFESFDDYEDSYDSYDDLDDKY